MSKKKFALAFAAVLSAGVAWVCLTTPALKYASRILRGQCPIEHATAAQLEQARQRAIQTTSASGKAPKRFALGFALGETRTEQLLAWAKHHQLNCTSLREGTLLRCSNVQATALPQDGQQRIQGAFDVLSLATSPENGTLINITALRLRRGRDEARKYFEQRRLALAQHLGQPSFIALSKYDATHAGPYATSSLEYRFSDYFVEVSSTNMPGRGTVIREHYMSATKASSLAAINPSHMEKLAHAALPTKKH